MIVKVRGYSEIAKNDRADSLTKETAGQLKEGTIGSINLICNEVGHKISLGLNWNNILIDSNLRKFNRIVSNSLADSHWSLGSIWQSPSWNDT